MTLLRAIAIFLVAAIANPICCCHADAIQTEKSIPHTCCEASKQAAKTGEQNQQHDPANCQHMAEKEAQISQSAPSGDSLLKPSFLITEALPAFLVLAEIEAPTDEPVRFNRTTLAIPDTPQTQRYCVYLL